MALDTNVEQFHRDGYTVVPGVLDAEEVATLRAVCGELLTAEGKEEMLPQVFLETPRLAALPFRDEVAAALRALLGEGCRVYPNLTVRKDLYTGWHLDGAFIGAGKEYVWADGFAHVQGAVYLQANEEETGGGLDVVPGSHRSALDGYGRVDVSVPSVIEKVFARHRPHRIRSAPGDLVLWDARLLHASTVPARSGSETGQEAVPTKFGVFFSAGRDDPYEINRYLSYLVSRRVRRSGGGVVLEPRHAAVLDVRFPDSYPAWLRERMAGVGVGAATF